jgi:hypothetical protein
MADNFVSSGDLTLAGLHTYNNFTLQAGHTLNIGTASELWSQREYSHDTDRYCVMLVCHGTCRIHGHVNGYARGPFGNDWSDSAYNTLPDGYSPDGVLGGAAGYYYHYSYSEDRTLEGGFCPESGAITNGADADNATALAYLKANRNLWPFHVYGGGGSGATYNDTGNPIRGGGGIWIQAKRIIFDGTMNLDGADGESTQWTYWSSGGDCEPGGAGGGVAVMIAEYIENTGSISVLGGAAGDGADVDSDPGGNGVVLAVKLPFQALFGGCVF